LRNFESPAELLAESSIGCDSLCEATPSAIFRETRPKRRFRNVLDAQFRERRLIIGELSKIRGLMPLLMKPRNGLRWTAEERAELHAQLRALMHLSPYLALLALPGSLLLLPLLAWWLDRRRVVRKVDRG
jgi:hypothetical protein